MGEDSEESLLNQASHFVSQDLGPQTWGANGGG